VKQEEAIQANNGFPDVERSNIISRKVVFSTTFTERSSRKGLLLIGFETNKGKNPYDLLIALTGTSDIVPVNTDMMSLSTHKCDNCTHDAKEN
jgi:hypothetical protein